MARRSEKKPAIQWYIGDWRKDPGVQSLDYETRGIWFEMLMIMYESQPRGKLVLNGQPMPDEALASLLGLNLAKVQQTVSKLLSYGVATREDETGILVNRRMLRDEHLRQVRAEAGAEGGKQKASKTLANGKQKATPSSSSSTSASTSKQNSHPPNPPQGGEASASEFSLEQPNGKKASRRKKQSVAVSVKFDESWHRAPWGTLKAFVALYNKRAPSSWPLVETVDDTRAAKIREYLTVFPELSWWNKTYDNLARSLFLQGDEFKDKGMDWLLQKGQKTQVRNCLLVHDGKFLR